MAVTRDRNAKSRWRAKLLDSIHHQHLAVILILPIVPGPIVDFARGGAARAVVLLDGAFSLIDRVVVQVSTAVCCR
jgi:hypothetical protein